MKPLYLIFLFLLIFILGVGVGYKFQNSPPKAPAPKQEVLFISEIYDKVKENYWNNISDAEALDLFKLSLDKNGVNITVAKFENKDKLLQAVKNITNDQAAGVVSSVLASLQPAGRSGLFTQKQEEALKNTVSNINPEKDLYKDLGLKKGASEAAVKEAFQKLSASASAQSLKDLSYAKETLTKPDTKQRYDSAGVEPTIFTKIAGPGILYVQFRKFSPASFEEFQKSFEKYKDREDLTALIFDLRGNIGGTIDATSYFLGNFLGKGQYAFDFYHKGEYQPFKTPTDKLASLSKYKQMVILVDNQTQSSAEMMAASLKKYHIGIVLGTPTKGWGTVERVFPIDNQIDPKQKYSLFLVHSITLRDDNQPIEGRGVDPDISVKDPAWPQKLLQYFNNPGLVEAIKTMST